MRALLAVVMATSALPARAQESTAVAEASPATSAETPAPTEHPPTATHHVHMPELVTPEPAPASQDLAPTPAELAEEPEEEDPTRPRFTALPGIFYGPETSVGFGATAGAFFDIARPETPGDRLWSRSWVLVAGAYTLNRQAITALYPYLVFREGRVVVDGELDVRRFPNRYFGMGRGVGPGYQIYTKEAISFTTSVLVQAVPRFYVGGIFSTGASRFIDASAPPAGEPNELWLGTGQVSGERFARPLGFGVRSYFDRRDHTRMTRHGYYAEATHLSFARALGSTHTFHALSIDLRGFVPIAHDASFAVQIQSIHTFGDVPFERMAFVGGPRGMRGFRLGRYVDHHHTFARAEVRFPIVWRIRGAVGSELGLVYGPGSTGHAAIPIWDVVAGIRFVIREQDRLLVRGDVAYGTNGFAGVLYLNESF